MCMDVCTDMCATCQCMDIMVMRLDICVDMRIDMCIDMCLDKCEAIAVCCADHVCGAALTGVSCLAPDFRKTKTRRKEPTLRSETGF